MVDGSAPGRFADTWMVGNSTLGNAATGMNRYATAPARNNPTESRMAAIGRSMNGNEKFSALLHGPRWTGRNRSAMSIEARS
jgi:hypothetical protein